MLTVLWGFWLAAVVIGSLLPAHRLPRRLPNDKLLHAVGFAGLTMPPCLMLAPSWALAAAAALFVLGVLIEAAQVLVPGRSFSLGDIAANGAGILIGLGAATAAGGLRWPAVA